MNDLNSIFMVGRIYNDPIIGNNVKTKEHVIQFDLLNNYNTFDDESKEYKKETGIYPVILFGKAGEKLAPYLKKGNRVGVNGRLKFIPVEGKFKDTGLIKIVAYVVQLLDSKTKS